MEGWIRIRYGAGREEISDKDREEEVGMQKEVGLTSVWLVGMVVFLVLSGIYQGMFLSIYKLLTMVNFNTVSRYSYVTHFLL